MQTTPVQRLLARHTRMAPKLTGVSLYNNLKWKWLLAGWADQPSARLRPAAAFDLCRAPPSQAGLTSTLAAAAHSIRYQAPQQ